jgi:hypothetical protein
MPRAGSKIDWIRVSWAVAGSLMALLLIGAVLLIIRQAVKSPEHRMALASDQALDDALKAGDVVVVGTIADTEGYAVNNASVALSLHNGDGQVVWRLLRAVDKDGSFRIRLQDLPTIPNLYAGVIAAEAPNFLAEKMNVSVDITAPAAPLPSVSPQPSPGAPVVTIAPAPYTRATTISPRRVHLRLVPYSSWLTLVVLIPAVFGLILAVLHLTQFARGMWVTYWYALGAAALWGLIITGLVLLYVWGGHGIVPLFWPDLFVSSGVIIFAFIGNIIYVAYSLYQKAGDPVLEGDSYVESNAALRRRILLALGGRILVAPYIALTAYGIFAATFPTLRTGPFAAFFGFFTGLFIKAILEALNDIGLRLLSPEGRQKVADHMLRKEAPEALPAPSSTAFGLRPEQAFLDAVQAARQEFLKKKNVIGIDAGFKDTSEGRLTGARAIIVYVYEKEEPENPDDYVPGTFMGFPTDVVPLPPANPEALCRQEVFNISWEKISADNEEKLKKMEAPPQDQPIRAFGEVLVLSGPSVVFAFNSSSNQQELDAKRAFQAVRNYAGDKFDFVAFIIDRKSGLSSVGNYYVPVHQAVKGINHHKGNFYSARAEWGTTRLLACQVHSMMMPDFRTYLHELAHIWCAYATFNDPVSGSSQSNEFLMVEDPNPHQSRYHWGEAFDDGRSCLDYDLVEWIANANATFTRKRITDERAFNYCPLDLYLMGLIPPSEVGPLLILQNRNELDSANHIYSCTAKRVTIEQVIASCGPRVPAAAASQKSFRQALVVVSKDPDSGLAFAQTIENNFRKAYEAQFARATGGRATLSTSIG